MAFQFGRAIVGASRPAVSRWVEEADQVSVSFETEVGTLADGTLIRQQILGYVDNPDELFVPITWDEDPTVDGYYIIDSATVTPHEAAGLLGKLYIDARIRRVRSFSSPAIEVTSMGAARAETHSGTPSTDWRVYVPVGATDLRNRVGETADTLTVASADGAVPYMLLNPTNNPWPVSAPVAASGRSLVAYTVPPSSFYKGAATLKSGGVAVPGRAPLDPTTWELGNGRVRITPAGGQMGFVLEGWNGTAWVAGSTIRPGIGANNSPAPGPLSPIALSAPKKVLVLRNSPAVCVIRVTGTMRFIGGVGAAIGNIVGTVDIALRRGDAFFTIKVSVPPPLVGTWNASLFEALSLGVTASAVSFGYASANVFAFTTAPVTSYSMAGATGTAIGSNVASPTPPEHPTFMVGYDVAGGSGAGISPMAFFASAEAERAVAG